MEYNLGLDIGVGSVGWCVTDINGNIIKKNNKNLWGSRLFNEAQTAKQRRTYRGSRRRLERRKERINMLQSLLLDDMEKQYPNFFPMLRDTSLFIEDRKVNKDKYNLFNDTSFSDPIYYDKYPTIYHLRKHLVESKEKEDIRLVYLAIHHIIKYRGNFLYEGDLNENFDNTKLSILVDFLKENDIDFNNNEEDIKKIITNVADNKATKKELFKSLFHTQDTITKNILDNVSKALFGYKFDLNKIFKSDYEIKSISFREEIPDEEDIIEMLGDDAELYVILKDIYNYMVLYDIKKDFKYVSDAFIEKYNQFKIDLKLLKSIYRKYYASEYSDMFRKKKENNYWHYNKEILVKSDKKQSKFSEEEFFKTIKKKIENLPDSFNEKENILSRINEGDFLKKLNTTDNAAIPYQLNKIELEEILKNQSQYYETLSKNNEKIISLLIFKIPYYAGPLSQGDSSKWGWVIRNSDEKIYPWNYDKVVNVDKTAEEFITRMTNNCTYLVNESVIPKNSLLYSEFCVLNELNNIRINGYPIAKDFKIKIVKQIFKNKNSVSEKDIRKFYKENGITVTSFTGLSKDDGKFISNLKSYRDFEKIFTNINDNNKDLCEEIIYWITIFEDKDILKQKLENINLNQQQIKAILSLNYSGWSRLSKKLINELKSNTGETIMDILSNTSMNFMQIITDEELGFDKQIDAMLPKGSNKLSYTELIDELPTSPANKRAIWQTLKVVKELKKVMKGSPSNIFIEFARREDEKIRTTDKLKTLKKIYDEIDKYNRDENVYNELKAHINDKNISEKLYLYFMQHGKCLYSGTPLSINELNLYEVDHILPQSYTSNDSIDNKALVIKRENQRKKDSLLLSDTIINKQINWWKNLLDNGLISSIKYANLTRREIIKTENDGEKFVKRQLVETRQITKSVANILKNNFENTNVLTIRAYLVTNVRKKYDLYKNRNVNDYHHAYDAFILCQVGNIINNKFKHKEKFVYGDYVKKYIEEEYEKYLKTKKLSSDGIVIGLIRKYIDATKLKKVLYYKDCYISRMLEENTGEFYNQTIYSHKFSDNLIPLKKYLPANKYGGFSNLNKAYMAVYSYEEIMKNSIKKRYDLIGIPINISYDIRNGKITLYQYLEETLKDKKIQNINIIIERLLIGQQYSDQNGNTFKLCSEQEIRTDKQLILNELVSKCVSIINKDETKRSQEENGFLKDNYEIVYDYLVEKINNHYTFDTFSSIANKLQIKKNDYNSLESNEKEEVLKEIIKLMSTSQGNLKKLGLGERAGRMSGKSFKDETLLGMTFINKSVTGIYEKRVTINGLENNSNKSSM